jgi:hypothetical protein
MEKYGCDGYFDPTLWEKNTFSLMKTFSIGIYEKDGNGRGCFNGRGKVFCRVKGETSNPGPAKKEAEAIVFWLNNGIMGEDEIPLLKKVIVPGGGWWRKERQP